MRKRIIDIMDNGAVTGRIITCADDLDVIRIASAYCKESGHDAAIVRGLGRTLRITAQTPAVGRVKNEIPYKGKGWCWRVAKSIKVTSPSWCCLGGGVPMGCKLVFWDDPNNDGSDSYDYAANLNLIRLSGN
jgi:hypothetical protein